MVLYNTDREREMAAEAAARAKAEAQNVLERARTKPVPATPAQMATQGTGKPSTPTPPLTPLDLGYTTAPTGEAHGVGQASLTHYQYDQAVKAYDAAIKAQQQTIDQAKDAGGFKASDLAAAQSNLEAMKAQKARLQTDYAKYQGQVGVYNAQVGLIMGGVGGVTPEYQTHPAEDSALTRLLSVGLVEKRTTPVRLGGVSSGGGEIYVFTGDMKTLTPQQRADLAMAGFSSPSTPTPSTPEYQQHPGAPATGGVTQLGESRIFAGPNVKPVSLGTLDTLSMVGVGPKATEYGLKNLGKNVEILGKGIGDFQNLSTQLRVEAEELKLKGDPFGGAIKFSEAIALDAGEIFGLALVAPYLLPAALGVTTAGLLGAAAINVGIGEGFNIAMGGKPLTLTEIRNQALFGEVFAIGGSAVMRSVGTVVPRVVESSVGRATINAIMGGGAGYVLSGGDIKSTAEGAVFGAAFSLGGEAIGRLPRFGIGSVEVPLESGEVIKWRGLYLESGENAKPILGLMGEVPEKAVISGHGPTGEAAGYMPETPIESAVTMKIMEKAGYPTEIISDVKDIRGLMGETQNIKSRFIQDILPQETGTLSAEGVATLKEFVIQNQGDVQSVYGSFATRNQLIEDVNYSFEGKTALRVPGDIDIQMKVGAEDTAKFAQRLVDVLSKTSEVRISSESPTLIEAKVGGKNLGGEITLYHGTSSETLKTILKEGINPNSYFTDDVNIAADFSMTKNLEMASTEPAVVKIRVTRSELDSFILGEKNIEVGQEYINKEGISPEKINIVKFNETGEPINTELTTQNGGMWAHAVDIHALGEPSPDVLSPETGMRWGFKLNKPTVKIEEINVMGAGEQGLRKGSSILGFTEDRELMLPVEHRMKDVPDFFQIQKTLLESSNNPLTKIKGEVKMSRLMERYGITDLNAEPLPLEYTFRSDEAISGGRSTALSVASLSPSVSPAKMSIKPSSTPSLSTLKYKTRTYPSDYLSSLRSGASLSPSVSLLKASTSISPTKTSKPTYPSNIVSPTEISESKYPSPSKPKTPSPPSYGAKSPSIKIPSPPLTPSPPKYPSPPSPIKYPSPPIVKVPPPSEAKKIPLLGKPGEKAKGRKKSLKELFGVRRVTYMGEDLPHAVGLRRRRQ
jgi:hypothetical protein